MTYIKGQFPQDVSLDTNEFKITRYFKKLLFEKKGNFFGDIFNLDDDEISINGIVTK